MGDKNTPDCATQGGGDAAWTENFDVLTMNSEAGAMKGADVSVLFSEMIQSGRSQPSCCKDAQAVI